MEWVIRRKSTKLNERKAESSGDCKNHENQFNTTKLKKTNSRNDSSSRELRKMPLGRALGIDARERFTYK